MRARPPDLQHRLVRDNGAVTAYLPAFVLSGTRAVLVARSLTKADILWLLDTAHGFSRPYMAPTSVPAGVRCASAELTAVDEAARVYTTWDENALPTDPPTRGSGWCTTSMHVTPRFVFWRVVVHLGTHAGTYDTDHLSIRSQLALGPAFSIVKSHMRIS